MGIKNKKILITCGPTWVPIDDTRVISNKSTGELGQRIALQLKKAGSRVTLLEGPVQQPLKDKKIKIRKFCYYKELLTLIQSELKKNYYAVIHAAAVSDYQLKKVFSGKLNSNRKQLQLKLVPTQKIITKIKKLNPKIFLVGFKLESRVSEMLAKRFAHDLFKKSKSDLVVVNNLSKTKYSGYIVNKSMEIVRHRTTREGLSKALTQILKDVQ